MCSHQIKDTAHRQRASDKIWQQQKFTNLICDCFSKTAQSTPSVLESDQLVLEEVTSSQAPAPAHRRISQDIETGFSVKEVDFASEAML